MLRRAVLGLLLGLLCVWSWGSRADPAAAVQGNPAGELFQLINQFRASAGLPAFEYNAALATAAQNHANWMAATVIYSHTGEGGSTPLSRAEAAGFSGYVSENIVGGRNMTPSQGLTWWQNSATHYNTLVSARYVFAGTGFATNGEQNMYVLVVGRPADLGPGGVRSNSADNSAEPLVITPIELATPRADGAIVHVVQPGQALWTIAAYYDVDLNHLYVINSLEQGDFLQPGDEVYVRLAEGQLPPPTPTPPLTHVVRAGETVWTIAARYGVPLDLLFLLNSLRPDALIRPGDELAIRLAPGQSLPPTPTPPMTHVVRAGETAWGIAGLYGLTLEQLLAFNQMAAEAILHPGDELFIRPSPTPTPTEVVPTATPAPAVTPTPPVAAANPSPASTQAAPRVAALGLPLALETRPAVATGGQPETAGGLGAAVVVISLSLLAGLGVLLARRR